LGVSVPTQASDFEYPIGISPSHEREARDASSVTGGEYAVLNPGGGWPTKLWAAEKFGLLADELWLHHGLHSLVTYGPGEKGLADQVLQASQSGTVHAINPSLKGFYSLVKNAKVYVGGDTGPTHLAVAAGAPVVGLFGPTEWWRNGSPHEEDICVERNDIECRIDCHRRACSQWICMDIDVERVFQAVTERLRRRRLTRLS
jgi:ADP-heptose:LPS heptosyltransferase